MTLLIKNIKTLYQTEAGKAKKWAAGKAMAQLPSINKAYLLIKEDKIAAFGKMDNCPTETNTKVIDATGKMVLPTWCDSHTHLVFAGSREAEFEDRIKGLSYEAIAVKGGGILNSAKKLNETAEEQLLEDALKRCHEIIATGTGAVEIKSGYGLSEAGELKILRVIKKLKDLTPLTIKATFLGAHAIPSKYKNNRQAYIDLLTQQILPKIADEQLADYIDVFCETNYFTVAEMETILEAGAKYNLTPKVHVNQFTSIGGIQAAIKHKALSVDHLELLKAQDLDALKNVDTIATVLPSCSFFIKIPYAPARKIIDTGLPLALASDYNPGSTPSGNIPFVLSLACIQQKLLPEEAINAVTLNGAYAMGLEKQLGTIALGKKANIIITHKMSSLAYLPYAFGSSHIHYTILNGRVEQINTEYKSN